MNKRNVSLLLGVIIVIGSYTRLIGIIDKAFAFTYDVGRDLLAVANIVNHFDIPLIGPTTGLPGLFYGPWWYYYLVPAFLLGGGNPQVVVGFIALCGIATVIGCYYLGKRLMDTTFGLLFAAFVSFSPVMVALSNQLWNPNIAPLLLVLILLTLYFLHKNERATRKTPKKSTVLLILLGFLLGLSLDAEVVYGMLLLTSVVVFVCVFHKKRAFYQIPFTLLGILLALLPRIAFELRHSFVMTHTILTRNQGEHSTFLFPSIMQVVKVFSALKTLWDETIGLNNQYIGWILLLFSGYILFTQYKHFSKQAQYFFWFTLVTIGTYFFGLLFFKGDIWSHYLVGISTLYLFLISMAFRESLRLKKLRYVSIVFCVFLFFLLLKPQELLARYTKPPWVGDASVYRNQLQIVDYLYHTAQGKPFNVEVYTPAVIDYPYQYLFSWYGKNTYGYVPTKEHQQLLFVIIEPDGGYAGRQTAWLSQREHEGKTVHTNTFSSGVTVQTRNR